MNRTKIGRNDLCPCGSGKKFKKCCRDIESVAKLRAHNDAVCEALVKQVRQTDPVRFEHQLSHKAFHETGHALMQMLFYRDLRRVTIVPSFETWEDVQQGVSRLSSGVCIPIEHQLERINAEEMSLHFLQQAATALAGKPSDEIFCTCGITAGRDSSDEEQATRYIPDLNKRQRIRSAVIRVIDRHRRQLKAVANALVQHETLSGQQVMEVMQLAGWNPDTDPDPQQFYNEVLGITEEGSEAA